MLAIKTSGLCKKYGTKNVVNQLSIEVPKGAIYGFIGRNGAGKSTTQKMVCGLINASQGEVQLFEKPLGNAAVRSKMGTLIEQPGLYPAMSAMENVMLQGYSIGIENPKAQAMQALSTVGLGKYAKKKAKHLSLGMKQRLGLAIAMLGQPQLLVLDEPINGLDPEGIIHLRKVIEQLNKELGVTIFISSHILGELAKIATHYGIIKDGELVEQISAKELAQKRKDYLHITVNDAPGALAALAESLAIGEYEMPAKNQLRLLSYTDTTSVNQLLAQKGFAVSEIYLHQQNLEEYFVQLMGAEQGGEG